MTTRRVNDVAMAAWLVPTSLAVIGVVCLLVAPETWQLWTAVLAGAATSAAFVLWVFGPHVPWETFPDAVPIHDADLRRWLDDGPYDDPDESP
jgi:hypothetical protein